MQHHGAPGEEGGADVDACPRPRLPQLNDTPHRVRQGAHPGKAAPSAGRRAREIPHGRGAHSRPRVQDGKAVQQAHTKLALN